MSITAPIVGKTGTRLQIQSRRSVCVFTQNAVQTYRFRTAGGQIQVRLCGYTQFSAKFAKLSLEFRLQPEGVNKRVHKIFHVC